MSVYRKRTQPTQDRLRRRRHRPLPQPEALGRHLWRGWWIRESFGLLAVITVVVAIGSRSLLVIALAALPALVFTAVFVLYRCPVCHRSFAVGSGKRSTFSALGGSSCAHCGARPGQIPIARAPGEERED